MFSMKFYKIIRSSNLQKSMIQLPVKFEKRFGDKLPKHVTLDVPSGAKWKVEVEKSDSGIWFMGQGWEDFVDSLVLEYGDFLMFEYDELRHVFHAVVMGMNASEIMYPAPAPDEEDPLAVSDDNDVVLVETETHSSFKKKGYHRDDGETILANEGQIQCVVQGRRVYGTIDGSEQAFARAKAFKATEPIFIVALQSSYLSRTAKLKRNIKCQLLVPLPFIEAYFDLEVKEVTLETCDGKTWPMQYRFSGRGVHSTLRVHFTSGWNQFAEDNCLKAGDVCLFVLNRAVKNALKVAIFRTTGVDEIPTSSSAVM